MATTTLPPASAARDTILDAAEYCFARVGFAGTTIKHIAAQARLNSALLYYYFTDKEDLYHAVLRRRLTALTDDVGRALGDGPLATPAETIRRFVQAYVGFLLLHPAVPSLIQRELLDHQASHALPEIRANVGAVFQRFADVIRQGQARGDFRPDVEPVNVAVSIVGQVVYAFMAQPLIQGVLLQRSTTAADAVWLRQYGGHVADFALRALAPIPSLRKSRPS